MVTEAVRAETETQLSIGPTSRRPPRRPLTFRPGEVLLNRYEIVRFIARGGMGEVYESHDRVLNATVALKTVICTRLDEEATLRRFLAEVRLARQVTHPNVCRIYDCGIHELELSTGEREPVPFLTMELLAGESLDQRIARLGRLQPDEARKWLAQIVAGLGAIHAAGIVHRDVKPHNMVILPGEGTDGGQDRLVLLDFGLASALAPGDVGDGASASRRIVGTTDYMAPEQFFQPAPTLKADVFALGVVAFEMLTGEKPWQSTPGSEPCSRTQPVSSGTDRLTKAAPRPSERVPSLDPRWDEVIARCLALDPAARWDRVEEVLAAAPAGEPGAAPGPRPLLALRHRRLFALAFVALAAVALGGAAFIRGRPSGYGLAGATPNADGRFFTTRRAFGGNGCSADMVRVADRFCIDRFEASIVDDRGARPASPYYPPSPLLLRSVLKDWTARVETGTAGLDLPLPEVPTWQREEGWRPHAVTRKGITPQGHISQVLAADACFRAGKRLCNTEEWTTACRGEHKTAFPYGQQYQAGACNINREDHPALVLHGDFAQGLLDPRMNQVVVRSGPLLRSTGSTPSCASRWGDDAVYDMVGNLDEWSADPDGTLLGGFYSRESRDGCAVINIKHGPSYYNYSTGFRCCDDLR